ncbi:MAG: UDP-N-acetylmuramoyl-L-alanine--D-glutamate ligase [bacterium]
MTESSTAHYSPNDNTVIDHLIVGLGATGLSVARYLARQNKSFAVVDSRANPPAKADLFAEFPQVFAVFGDFPTDLFLRAQQLIVSPGIAVATPIIQQAQQCGAEIIGDIELFVRDAQAPIIAITGSNGKSSVTTLVAKMAQAAGLTAYAGGNLGTTALDLLTQPTPDLYVMELSSFQLETTHSLQAEVAVILNVCEDHMDRYDSYADYVAAKRKIYHNAKCAVINRDDSVAAELPHDFSEQVMSFGQDAPQSANQYGLRDIDGKTYLVKGDDLLLASDEMKLLGAHNVQNALAALALLDSFSLPMSPLLQTIREFSGLAHRTQWVAEHNGIRWFNDSKGTNVGATIAALSGLPNKTVLIAGGQGKGADFTPLSAHLAEKARAVVLIGEDQALIKAVTPSTMPTALADSMQDAVRLAASFAQAGDNVLLSPACASFDMFKSYIHRGNVFTEAVQHYLTNVQANEEINANAG